MWVPAVLVAVGLCVGRGMVNSFPQQRIGLKRFVTRSLNL